MQTLKPNNLRVLNSAAMTRIGADLGERLQLASKHCLGVRLQPHEVDAVLGMLTNLRLMRAERNIAGRLRGLISIALAPFEE